MSLLTYVSVRNTYARKGTVAVHFLPNYNMQEDTSKLIYTLPIFDYKQLLSNMIDHKATHISAKIFFPAIVDYSF